MEHGYDVGIATKYGVVEAVLLKHLYWWIEKNQANEKNFYDGRYWTYNSIAAFVEIFPEFSKAKIGNALKRLENEGIIVVGNYNKIAYDRTKWYAITEKGFELLKQKHNSNFEFPFPKTRNGNEENEQPIPDKEPVKVTSKKEKNTIKKEDAVSMINNYTQNSELRSLLTDWVDMRIAERNSQFKENGLRLALRKLDRLAPTDSAKIELVENAVISGWKSFYARGNNSYAKMKQEPDHKVDPKVEAELRKAGLWED